jgi:hypothetical protein
MGLRMQATGKESRPPLQRWGRIAFIRLTKLVVQLTGFCIRGAQTFDGRQSFLASPTR